MPITIRRRALWMTSLSIAAAACITTLMGLREPARLTAGSTPTLTVAGFAVVNLTQPTETTPPQLELNFQETAAKVQSTTAMLNTAMASVRARLQKAGVRANAISTQGPPNLNNQNGSWQADSTVQVTFRSIAQLEKVVDETNVSTDTAIQNVWINTPSVTMRPTQQALAAAYVKAVGNAEKTAMRMAAADHRQLGAQLALTEGAGGTQCGAMACGSGTSLGITPPAVGNNQELVAVSLTYATTP